MKCTSCGFECADNAEICEKCGCALNPSQNTADITNKKSNPKKPRKGENLAAIIVPICAVLLLAAMVFLIISSIVETSEEIEVEDYYIALYDEEKDVTYFLFKGKLVDGHVRGRCEEPYTDGVSSEDGTVVIVRSPTKRDDRKSTLYAITPSRVAMISDSVDCEDSSFDVSKDGSFAAYMISDGGALYIYDVKNQTSEVAVDSGVEEYEFSNGCSRLVCLTSENELCSIDMSTKKITSYCDNVKSYAILDDGARLLYLDGEDELYLYTDWSNSTEKVASDVTDVCVSDGNMSFAYTVSEEDENSSVSFFRKGQKDVQLGEDVELIALDDSGDHIYTRNLKNGDMYLMGCEEDSVTVFEGEREYFISEDLSEILYTLDGETFLFSKKNGSVSICKDASLIPLSGENEEKRFTERFFSEEKVTADGNHISLVYIDENAKRTELVSDIDEYTLSDDGSFVFAEKDGKIYSAKKESKPAVELCEGSLEVGMYITAIGKQAVYIKEENNDEDETFSLYWCEGGDKTLVSDRVSGECYMSHDGFLFFTELPLPASESTTSGETTGKDRETDTPPETVDPDEIFDADSEKGLPLYCSKNGQEKIHITNNLCMIRVSKSSAYIITPSESYDKEKNPVFSVYGGVKGNKFKLIIEEITIYEKDSSDPR